MANFVGAVLVTAGEIGTAYDDAPMPVGTIVQTDDGGEYIMLEAGEAVGTANYWVSFDENFVALKLAGNAVGSVGITPVALASGQFAWVCITSGDGGVTGSCDTIAADKACYIDGTAGRVDDSAVTGDLVCGAISRSADSSNLATFQIRRPFVNDVLG